MDMHDIIVDYFYYIDYVAKQEVDVNFIIYAK